MVPREIRIGHVLRYSYLWHRQFLEGREEADKDRPCVVLALVVTDSNGAPFVRVLPITHTPPANPGHAIEIPQAVKNRLKLDDDRSCIVLTESNKFAWPGPDLRPVGTDNGYYGPLPPALFEEVKRRFVALARNHKQSGRTE